LGGKQSELWAIGNREWQIKDDEDEYYQETTLMSLLLHWLPFMAVVFG